MFRLQKVFQDFNSRTKEGDGAVTSTLLKLFSGFWNRGYYWMFPNGRKIAVVKWEVVKTGEVLDPNGPRFLRWWIVKPSGPTLLELPLSLIAWATILVVKRCVELSSGHSLGSSRLTIWVDGSLVWSTIEMNCLSKAVAIYRLWVRVLNEKVIGWLWGIAVHSPLRDLSRLHRREGFVSTFVCWSLRYCDWFVRWVLVSVGQ